MPKVFIVKEEDEVCEYAAELVARRISAHGVGRPFVLGLPSAGWLSARLLQRIVVLVRRGGLSFENVVTFCPDELCGVPRGHAGTTHAFLWEHLFRRIDIHPKNVHMLDGNAEDVHAECRAYEALLEQHPVDLWLCTVSPTGQLAYNEAGSSLKSCTRPKTLAQETKQMLASSFGGAQDVPPRALTVGVATVLAAKEMVVVTSGEAQSRDVRIMLGGSVGHMSSFSAVQLHNRSTVICDDSSCARLSARLHDYYKNLMDNVMHNELLRPDLKGPPDQARLGYQALPGPADPGLPAGPDTAGSQPPPVWRGGGAVRDPLDATQRIEGGADLAPEKAEAPPPPAPAERGAPPRVTQITNIQLLRGGRLVDEDLWVCDGKVIDPSVRFWEAQDRREFAADLVVNGHGAICAPGLIDIQINGAFGVDFTTTGLQPDDVTKVCRGVLGHGCTAICPTVITSSREMYRRVLPLLRRRGGSAALGAHILGAHVEGPFLSELKYGAHDKNHCATPKKGFATVVETYGRMDCVAIVTLAPELPGACDAVAGLAARGVRVSLGHSNATFAETEAGISAGANLVTHMFNAMRSFQHRDPGLVGVLGSMAAQRPYYGLIVDGLHAHPASVRLAYGSHPKGCVLVTDAMEAMGMPPGKYQLAGREVTVREAPVRGGLGVGDVGRAHRATLAGTETLAGAVPTLIECVRNLCTFTGCPFVSALEAASLHPARALGIERRKGALDFGMDADFILLSPPADGRLPATALRVLSTWLAGERAWEAPPEQLQPPRFGAIRKTGGGSAPRSRL